MANNPIFHSQYTAQQIENEITNGVPRIIDGYWWRWDIATGTWVNTGDSAEGAEAWHGIAEEFSTSTDYAVGDLCIYGGELYVCTTAHSGAWDAGDFAETTVDAQKASMAVALGAYPTETSSGATAETDVGADGIPLKELEADITAVWGGEGTPSTDNIRPIAGWTGLTITHGEDEIPISWQTEAGTVYGGTLDVLTGVLTVTHWGKSFVGNDIVGVSGSGLSAIYQTGTENKIVTSGTPEVRIPYSSHYRAGADPDAPTSPYVTCSTNGTVIYFSYVNMVDGSVDLAAFQAYLDAQASATPPTPVQLVWKLATPKTYQLSSVAVKSVLGANSISSDVGDVSATYRCDPNLYIAAQINDSISDAIGGSY